MDIATATTASELFAHALISELNNIRSSAEIVKDCLIKGKDPSEASKNLNETIKRWENSGFDKFEIMRNLTSQISNVSFERVRLIMSTIIKLDEAALTYTRDLDQGIGREFIYLAQDEETCLAAAHCTKSFSVLAVCQNGSTDVFTDKDEVSFILSTAYDRYRKRKKVE